MINTPPYTEERLIREKTETCMAATTLFKELAELVAIFRKQLENGKR